jgi:prenyltransferase beta subunit
MMRQRMYRLSSWFLSLTIMMSLLGRVFVLPVAAAPASDPVSRMQASERALTWLLAQQNTDGSYGGSAGTTIEVVFAAAAAGRNLETWHNAGNASTLAYLSEQAEKYAADPGSTGKLLAAVVAANLNPHSFGGIDLVERLKSQLANQTLVAATAIQDAWALLGLAAAGQQVPQDLVTVLIALQSADGGWEWAPGFGTDSNSSALVVQALAASGVALTNPALVKALDYFKTQLSPEGGFTYSTAWGNAADADSTAYGIQTLLAAGIDPSDTSWSANSLTPLMALLGGQLANGAFEWQPNAGANLLATAQAVPALLGIHLPLRGAYTSAMSALASLKGLQQADGSYAGGMGSNVGPTVQVLLALGSAGVDPASWKTPEGASLLDYLRSQAAGLSDIGLIGRLVTGLVLAGVNPYDVNSELVSRLKAAYIAESGLYDANQNTWNQSLAIWGLRSVGDEVPVKAITWLKNAQNADGGWGWAAGQNSDTNSTGIVMQALASTGIGSLNAVMQKAVAYLRTQQSTDGGFVYDLQFGNQSDANSTAGTLQGLLAAGVDAKLGFGWARANGDTVATPLGSLLALQLPDGSFEWQQGSGTNLLATAQAIPALLKVTFPQTNSSLAVRSRAVSLGEVVVDTLQGSNAGAFTWYRFTTVKQAANVSITLSDLPGDPLASNGLGFAVYGPTGVLAMVKANGGQVSVTLPTETAGQTWLIQVYNYLPNLNVRYTLSIN